MKRWVNYLLNIIIIFITICLLGLAFYIGKINFLDEANKVSSFLIGFLCFLGLIFSFFIIPLMHELGHLFFGLANKMSFLNMRVGFLCFYREGKKIKMRFANCVDYAGACEMISKNTDKIYKRFMLMALGGLIFSLLYLIFLVFVIAFAKNFGLIFYCILVGGLPTAFYLFTINALPLNTGNGRTDGGVVIGLLKKDSAALVTINILTIQSLFFLGKTPSQIDEKLYFDLPQLPEDDINFLMLLNLRYLYYLDKNNIDEALKISERLLSIVEIFPLIIRQNIESDILFNACKFYKNESLANKLYQNVKNYLTYENTPTNLRIRASYNFYILNNYEEARRLVNMAIDEAEKYSIKGIGIFEQKLLKKLKEEITQKLCEEISRKKQENINMTRIFK